jgi:hypothetical protein
LALPTKGQKKENVLVHDTKLDLVNDTKLDLVHDTKLDLVHDTKLDLVHDTKLDLVHDTKIDLVHDKKFAEMFIKNERDLMSEKVQSRLQYNTGKYDVYFQFI